MLKFGLDTKEKRTEILKMGALKLIVVVLLVALTDLALCQDPPPPIEEPAFLVVTPSRPVHLSGGRISMTCVAYGSPVPDIIWSSASQGIADYQQINKAGINIHTFEMNDPTTGFPLQVSILELCDAGNNASLVTDYQCMAVNSFTGSDRTPLGVNTAVFDIEPLVREPAILVAAPTQNTYQYRGSRLSVTCAAFGSPRPRVWISAPSLGITDFSQEDNPLISVYSEDIDTGAYVFRQTTLEICVSENDRETFERYLTSMVCTTDNGVKADDVPGIQTVSFLPAPSARIASYEVTYEVKRMQITVEYDTFSNPNVFGCTIRPFSFSKSSFASNLTFSPQYPGSCEIITDTQTRFTLDNRDFVELILAGFNNPSSTNFFLYTTEGLEKSFAPPIALEPIERANPLQAISYTVIQDPDVHPRLLDFDVYIRPTDILLYLHFDAIVSAGTLDVNLITLASSRSSSDMQTLSAAVLNNDGPLIKTACVRVLQEGTLMLARRGICTNSTNCFLFIPQVDYVRSHTASFANEIPQTSALQSRYYFTPPDLGPVYMQLTIQFIGCTLDLPLATNQPYRIDSTLDETITKITCFSDNVDNINPDFHFNGQKIANDYLTRNWTYGVVTFNSPDGVVTANQLGLFTCSTYRNTASISHVVQTSDPFVFFVDGNEYTAELFERIVIRFTYYTTSGVEGFFTISEGNSAPSFEVAIDTSSPFIAVMVLESARLSMTGQYSVNGGGSELGSFSITVRVPTLEVSPAAIAFLLNETMSTVTCTPSNPLVSVSWVRTDALTQILSSQYTYGIRLTEAEVSRLEGESYSCIVLDPEGSLNPVDGEVIAREDAPIRIINDTMSVYTVSGGVRRQVFSEELIVVANRFSADTYLECLGHAPSGVTDLYWTIAQEGEEPLVTNSEIDDGQYRVTLGDNYITLSIVHSNQPFRGAVNCHSRRVKRDIAIFIRANDFSFPTCPEDLDLVWRQTWSVTPEGVTAGLPCPMINRRQTTGTARRTCMDGGVWSRVDATECRLADFAAVEDEAEELSSISTFLSDNNFMLRTNQLSTALNEALVPDEDSMFPTDIRSSISIVTELLRIIQERQLRFTHTLSVDTFDRLLHENNIEAWLDLLEMGDMSNVELLNLAESFGMYLCDDLAATGVSNRVTYSRDNVAFNVINIPTVLSNESFMFGDVASGFVKVSYKEELLLSQQPRGIINVGFRNLNSFLPRSQPNFNDNRTTIIASLLVSTQFRNPPTFFPEDSPLDLQFITLRTARVFNPRVVFWDFIFGRWSEDQVESTHTVIDNGEFKVFDARAVSYRLGTFGVAMDVNTNTFNFSIPVWVGCGVVLLGCLLAIFALSISCLADDAKKYFTVAFTIHLSFFVSLIFAFVAFLAGVELALEQRIGCAATAGLLHYFFTAAFSWLLCESILLSTYTHLANKWPFVFLFLLIGWGLPAIPTAISLGLLHPSYGTTTQCWFYFDGDVSQEVVLGFLVPKIILVSLILICVVVGMIMNFRFATNYRVRQRLPSRFNSFSCMLWFLWVSVIFLTLLLSASWVFSMLLVNVYGLDSETLGWVFLGVSAALGLYIFIFAFVVLIVNQRIDYDGFFTAKGPHIDDPNVNYRGLTISSKQDRFSTSRLSGSNITVPNPTFIDDDREIHKMPAVSEHLDD